MLDSVDLVDLVDSVDLVDDGIWIWYLHNKETAFYELSTCGILSALCAARLVNQRPAGDDGVQIYQITC